MLEGLEYNNVSYLRARDPSIFTSNWGKVRVNLQESFCEQSESSTSIWSSPEDEKICVYLRIKNNLHNHNEDVYSVEEDNMLKCKFPPGSHTISHTKPENQEYTKKFHFSRIFPENSTQEAVFDSVVRPKLLDFINGKSSSILTYGASGSGKTYTLIGTDKNPGLVPRSLEYLFRTLPKLSGSLGGKIPPSEVFPISFDAWKEERRIRNNIVYKSQNSSERQHIDIYKSMQQNLMNETAALLDDSGEGVSLNVWVSFAEIYNEQIYDLLQPESTAINKQRPRLALGRCGNNTYIKNLTAISVTSGLEAYDILHYGLAKLKCAATKINDHSSRSHSIFTIKLIQVSNTDGGISLSKFNFCDLAGSERTKKTLNIGARLKESNNINSSLLVLGRCIKAVRKVQKANDQTLVPFRESKLTQFFQNALSGVEDMSMIVTINPTIEMLNESHHVLNFSAIAKEITMKEEPTLPSSEGDNKDCDYLTTTYSEELPELRKRVKLLEEELKRSAEILTAERENKEHVRKTYEKVIEDFRESQNKQIALAQELARFNGESELKRLKQEYEKKLKEKLMTIYKITVHDSSSDESEEEDSFCITERQELEEDIENVLEQIKNVEEQRLVWNKLIQEKDLDILGLTEKRNDLKSEIEGLQQQITASVLSDT